MMITPKKQGWLKRFYLRYQKQIAIGILITALTVVFSRLTLLKIFLELKNLDFYQYWTMARMFVAQGNPYNPAEFYEQLKLFDPGQAAGVYPFYFPWVLPLLAPFGLLPYATGHLLWFVFSFLIIIITCLYAWKLYRGKPTKLWIAFLVMVSFYPIIFSLYLGQATIYVLLGITAFLYFIRKENDFLAGLAVVLLTIKPNVVYLVLLSILVMVLIQRRWKVIAGGVSGMAVLLALTFAIHPRIFAVYLQSMAQNPPTEVLGASLYGLVSGLLNRQATWVIYLAVLVGLMACGYHIYINRQHWQWERHIHVPIILSMLTTPYIWIHDGILLLIPIVYVITLMVITRQWRWVHTLVVLLYVLLDSLAFKYNGFIYPPHLFYWIPLGFGILFFMAVRIFKEEKTSLEVSPTSAGG